MLEGENVNNRMRMKPEGRCGRGSEDDSEGRGWKEEGLELITGEQFIL